MKHTHAWISGACHSHPIMDSNGIIDSKTSGTCTYLDIVDIYTLQKSEVVIGEQPPGVKVIHQHIRHEGDTLQEISR